jgi:hypothetical protein
MFTLLVFFDRCLLQGVGGVSTFTFTVAMPASMLTLGSSPIYSTSFKVSEA